MVIVYSEWWWLSGLPTHFSILGTVIVYSDWWWLSGLPTHFSVLATAWAGNKYYLPYRNTTLAKF